MIQGFHKWKRNVNHIWQLLLYTRRVFYKVKLGFENITFGFIQVPQYQLSNVLKSEVKTICTFLALSKFSGSALLNSVKKTKYVPCLHCNVQVTGEMKICFLNYV